MKIRIYDNGGKTLDRYTAVFIDRPIGYNNLFEAIGFNSEPFHGFGQHCHAQPGRHLGKRIALEDLPPNAKKFVQQEME